MIGGLLKGLFRPLTIAPFFVWLVVPAGLYAAYLLFGLPHVIWSYEWHALGRNSYSDFSQRHYTSCSYLGPYGLFRETAVNGTCGWVRFRHKAEGRS